MQSKDLCQPVQMRLDGSSMCGPVLMEECSSVAAESALHLAWAFTLRVCSRRDATTFVHGISAPVRRRRIYIEGVRFDDEGLLLGILSALRWL